MSWKKLPRRGRIRSGRPMVGIHKSGRIVWNKGTQDALGDPAYVDVLYHEETKRLGVRKSAQVGIVAFPVTRAKGRDSWGVYAKSALKPLGIQVQEAHRRFATIEEGIATISLVELMKES